MRQLYRFEHTLAALERMHGEQQAAGSAQFNASSCLLRQATLFGVAQAGSSIY
jgi:hypothetical protein